MTLLEAQSGKQISSPSHRLIKNRTNLILCKIKAQSVVNISIQNSHKLIKIPGHGIVLQIDSTNVVPEISPESVILDLKTLKFPLTLRNWNEGDYFYPSGMKGKKKLSKFFKDQKLSLVEKENVLILCSNDQVVWVLGMRTDNRFISSKKTINFLKISIINNASN
jgi:tRNA(Ile)-lysidine synthase